MHWLNHFLAIPQGRSNGPVRDQFKEEEDTRLSHDKENLLMSIYITPKSETIQEEEEDTEPGFMFNYQKDSLHASQIV